MAHLELAPQIGCVACLDQAQPSCPAYELQQAVTTSQEAPKESRFRGTSVGDSCHVVKIVAEFAIAVLRIRPSQAHFAAMSVQQ